MAKRRTSTFMQVDTEFFDKLFEPARKKAMLKLGISSLGQREFSKMIFKSGMKLDVKLNTPRGKKNVRKISKR